MRLRGTPIAWLYAHVHGRLYRWTSGRMGGSIRGEPGTPNPPVLLLTTIGRRSGKPRATPLIYLETPDEIVVMAANAGHPRDPDWWQNLKANPRGRVQIGARELDVVGSEITGPRRDDLWRRYAALYPPVDAYQRGTTRTIPLIALRAVDGDRRASGT
jgi:deazaflavin-dependent oxidoreductase (nitroreductase family)